MNEWINEFVYDPVVLKYRRASSAEYWFIWGFLFTHFREISEMQSNHRKVYVQSPMVLREICYFSKTHAFCYMEFLYIYLIWYALQYVKKKSSASCVQFVKSSGFS